MLLATPDPCDGFPWLDQIENKIAITRSKDELIGALQSRAPMDRYALKQGVFRLRNRRWWFVPIIPKDWFEGGIGILAVPVGRIYRFERVMTLGRFLPQDGFLQGRNLVLSGINYWMSNYGRAAAAHLRKGSKGWFEVKRISPEFEGGKCRFLQLGTGCTALIEGPTYPHNFNVSHSEATVEMRQSITYANGLLRTQGPYRTMNPMAELDDIIGAVRMGHYATVRRKCATKAIAKQIQTMRTTFMSATWHPMENKVTNTLFFAEQPNLYVEFTRRRGAWLVTKIEKANQ